MNAAAAARPTPNRSVVRWLGVILLLTSGAATRRAKRASHGRTEVVGLANGCGFSISASRIIVFYFRLRFIIKMKRSEHLNPGFHKVGAWVAAHPRRVLGFWAVAIVIGAL